MSRQPAAHPLLRLSLPLLLAASLPLAAQEAPASPAPPPRLQVGGYVDLYYAANFNRPPDGTNFFAGADVSASRDAEFAVNLAAVEVKLDPAPLGFNLVMGAGDELTVLHGGEPASSKDTFKNVYQASVAYASPLGRGLRIDAGIYPSHIGFEGALTRDNWNYTGSWGANFSPYYQAGIKLSYPFTDHLAGELHVVNGWQTIGDVNRAKSLGTRLAWTTAGGSVAFNTWAGPELPDDNRDWRTLYEIVATARAGPRLELAFDGSVGGQQRPDASAARWTALAGYLRWHLAPRWSLAFRGERFADPLGAISGFAQTLTGGTCTLELRPRERAILKLEARYDRSTLPVFSSHGPAPKRDQPLLVLGTAFTF